MIIADVTGNGRLSGLDAAYVARKAVGLEQPVIPDLPDKGSMSFHCSSIRPS